jgi:hypothetical protein
VTRFTRIARTLTAIICAAIVAGVAAVSASAGGSAPPGDVYTCSWISEHSAAAAAAGVTCDPVVFFMETGPASQVGAAQVDDGPTITASPDNLCNWIPAQPTLVGQGVYAWSNYEYADYWNFKAYSSPYNYEWYLQKLDGTNQYYGSYSGSGTDPIHEKSNLGYTNRRFGGHNLSSTPTHWYVCHD